MFIVVPRLLPMLVFMLFIVGHLVWMKLMFIVLADASLVLVDASAVTGFSVWVSVVLVGTSCILL